MNDYTAETWRTIARDITASALVMLEETNETTAPMPQLCAILDLMATIRHNNTHTAGDLLDGNPQRLARLIANRKATK